MVSFVTSDLQRLNIELDALGAAQVQRELLQGDPTRALAALSQATKRGAGQPLSYAISLFNAESFTPQGPKPRLIVVGSPRGNPKVSDEGERIWHALEVDDAWRRDYLAACIDQLLDDEESVAPPRYEPSEHEWTEWMRAMKRRVPELQLHPAKIRWQAEHALSAWAEVWGFDDLIERLQPKELVGAAKYEPPPF